MKKKDIENKLKELGWWLHRQGGDHEIWTNGEHIIPVPRHKKVNEFTAKNIIRKAFKNKK